MQRRRFIQYLTLGGAVAGIGAGYAWLNAGRDHTQLSIAATLQRLESLSSGDIQKTGVWNPHQVFNHCAQSVEFSMTGFPQSKSPVFQHTAGRLAFSVFSAKGEMSHPLDEVIPGAPGLAVEGDVTLALQRLATALRQFESFEGTLQPHFAFGQLDKADYALAHVLHINNHLQEFQPA